MSTSTPSVSLDDLPREVLIVVLSHLAARDWVSLACTSRYLGELVKDDMLWQDLALRKWGPAVDALAAPGIAAGAWQPWVRHRCSTVSLPGPSPLDLIQERYPDPWAHLACCLLCSRTTGGPAVRAAIDGFLEAWPTPSAVLGADETLLEAAIRPCGLQNNRVTALKAMSRDFLATDWALPSEFKGCGKFTADSFRIFCRGHRDTGDVDDANLKRFLSWLNRDAGGGAVDRKKKKERKKAVAGAKRQKKEMGAKKGAGVKKQRGRGEGLRRSGRLTAGA